MTERGRAAMLRDADCFRLGPSAICWRDGVLEIDIAEWGAPLPKRVRGKVRVRPDVLPGRAFPLDASGRHVWQPIAPIAQIEVALEKPALAWRGSAYLDSNFGSEPLEAGFKQWTWSRAHREQDCAVLYDAERRDGTHAALALRFGREGQIESFDPPPLTALPRTFWRVGRATRSEGPATIERTLEDAPFYARSIICSSIAGERSLAFHESLDLDRFSNQVVRAMLPFRMPRRVF